MIQSFKDVFQHRKWIWKAPPSKKYTDAAAHFQLYLRDKNNPSAKPHPSSRSEHSHHILLDHPEILERIFGFLSQHTLRTNVRLVCVHWNNVARPLIILVARWHNQDDSAHDLFSLYPFFNTLSLTFSLFTIYDTYDQTKFQEDEAKVQTRWIALVENVQYLSQQGQLHFRTLRLEQPFKIQNRLFPIFVVVAPTLTKLDLFLVQDKILYLGPIMAVCHHLKTLLVHGSKASHPYGMVTLLKNRDPLCPDHTSASGHAFAHPESSRHLTRLCIYFVHVLQVDLEALIQRCPNLRVLSLELAIYPVGTTPEDTFFSSSISPFMHNDAIIPLVDTQPLIHFVRAHCPLLARFQFTPLNGHSSLWRDLPDMITTTSPRETSLCMPGAGASWQRIKPYIPHFARLTTLRIQGQLAVPQVLHMILCTAPLLLEVVASKAQYPGEYLYPPDADARLPQEVVKDVDAETLRLGLGFDWKAFSAALEHYAGRGGGFQSGKEVWVCRGLRVLDLGIRAAEFGPIGTATLHECRVEMTRMIFVYLVIVCPMLRDLTLHREDGLWPGLDGGMCLLAELEDLERIEIRTGLLYGPRERDFDWLGGDRAYPCKLTSEGTGSQNRRGSWQESRKKNGRASDTTTGNYGPVDRDSLVGKWSLQEVKEVRSRLLDSGVQVWPRLTYLCIKYQGFSSSVGSPGIQLEYVHGIVRGMRPAVEFICKPNAS
ncbi:hypothetical protein BG003_009686 [Podila horticola]|nr:hypothetical protein BG003_009686 [Podila horticola]